MPSKPHKLTIRHRTVIDTLFGRNHQTRKQLGLRDSRVLWVLEERGYVRRNSHDQWSLTAKGEAASKWKEIQ